MTDLLAWLNPTRWLVILGAAASLMLGYDLLTKHKQGNGEARANVRWQIATDDLKREAAAKLATETARVQATQQALQDFKNQQELKDANNQKTVADLAGRLRAAGPTGRLRDPNAAGCGRGSDSAPREATTAPGDRPDDRAETGGLLSVELSGLLRARIEEADTINNAYIACRADANAVRAP